MRRWFVRLTLGMISGAVLFLFSLVAVHWFGSLLWGGVILGGGLLVGCNIGLEVLKRHYQVTTPQAIFRLLNWS
ncbi:hypothetical protein [Lactiplantibacillus paraplantarum]|uniref:Uncharacterized protein n=1 Tax=Lactiplantibacillus paraplantarum TaxID=60520 RepID=A0A2I9CXR7_9LACO|nr:hypothetical protein [Lactiplantibacillus paraplantarum]AVW10889.1 hypothetical protein DA077_10225 [Lactiplantibacillus paraplantarum]AYJ39296.1 hypothetical protein LP667_11015 [Lactiplantibacillus paraplantarum]ERL42913.1 hypothetical protein N644_3068 [Lactiplantibacillus paraplantarum]MCU4684352.1 hypothetical protein [Lactiplantibacillus paraplantarum]MDL2061371.1 hypothetical protein [Lactiplantibacillus paraplantarum]